MTQKIEMPMTPKQEERIRTKIARIRKELAQDKKRHGGFYDDSRGLRYLPPELFIKLKDYKGGLRYLQWFNRTFPDDSGFAIFLFEWALILFQTGNLREAEKKAFRTYMNDSSLIEIFLEYEPSALEKEENSNRKIKEFAGQMDYTKADPGLVKFAEWLEITVISNKFKKLVDELLYIDRKLEAEPVGQTRSELVRRRYDLIDEL